MRIEHTHLPERALCELCRARVIEQNDSTRTQKQRSSYTDLFVYLASTQLIQLEVLFDCLLVLVGGEKVFYAISLQCN